MWRPFDARFEGILESLDFQTTILGEEINFLLLGQIQDEQESQHRMLSEGHALQEKLQNSFNKFSKDAFLTSSLKWLHPPPEFKENLEQAQAARVDGTAEWIFENPVFIAWMQSKVPFHKSGRLLWINGNPGSGKTVLAGSITEELDRQPEDGTANNAVFYYLFNETSGTRNSGADAYRSIATQILQQFCHDQMIQDIFAIAMSHYPVQTNATENELLDLMLQVFHHFRDTTIILDGLDECTDGERLCKEISRWCYHADVKVLLLSRPNVLYLRRRLAKETQIALSRNDLDDDIAMYLEPRILELKEEGLLPPDSREDDLVTRLVSRAEGMFLWARLMVTFLRSPALTRSERLETITETTPDGLHGMYQRIHSQILLLDGPSRELACQALTWVAYSPRNLGCSEIRHALKPDEWEDSDAANGQFHDAVIFSSCGLLEKNTHRNTYQYIHLSAREYFGSFETRRRNSLTPLIPEEHRAKGQILKRCISLLTYEIPLRPLSTIRGRNGSDDIKKALPLLHFASLEWIPLYLGHANSALQSNDDLEISQRVSKFLGLHLNVMVWIESLYTFEPNYIAKSAAALDLLIHRRSLLAHNDRLPSIRSCLYDLSELFLDLKNLDEAWNSTLAVRPSAIWEDVTLFTKSRFLVPTKAGSLQTLAPSMELEGEGTGPMFCISRSSEDGSRLAILAIYPSRSFIAHHRGTIPKGVKKTCQGWIANFETRSLNEGQSQVSSRLTTILDAGDVELFLKQQHGERNSTIKLPISIQPDLNCFTVFNKLFFSIGGFSKAQLSSVPIGLPLQADHRLSRFWSLSSAGDNYEYEISWTDDGNHLVFVDGHERSSSSWIGVFRTGCCQELQEPLELVNSTYHRTYVGTKKAEATCHPERPVLAIRIGRYIYLWPFLQGSPFTFHQLPRNTMILYPQDSVKMSFSHCGRYLVTSCYAIGNGRPETLPLPQDLETADTQSKQTRGTDLEEPQNKASPSELVSVGNDASVVTRGTFPRFISDSRVAISSSSSGTTVTTVRTNVLPYHQVELVQCDSSGKRDVMPLLHIPSTFPADGFSVTVHSTVGDDQNGLLKIILNKTSTNGSVSTQSAGSENLPLVIWKDPKCYALGLDRTVIQSHISWVR